MDIRGGMYQSLWDYFLEAWVKAPQTPYMCFAKVQHVSANSLCLLKQYEDALGGAPYEECIAPDWSTFPGIVSILWWHPFSKGAIALTMILGPIFLLGSRNSR